MLKYLPMSDTKPIETTDAAARLGMTQMSLLNWLYRNPTFKPRVQVGQSYLWTEAEIEAVRAKRVDLRSRKPKTGQK